MIYLLGVYRTTYDIVGLVRKLLVGAILIDFSTV